MTTNGEVAAGLAISDLFGSVTEEGGDIVDLDSVMAVRSRCRRADEIFRAANDDVDGVLAPDGPPV